MVPIVLDLSFPVATVDTDLMGARMIAFDPQEFCPLATVSGTPVELVMTIIATIQAVGKAAACMPLINFLLISCTYHDDGNGNNVCVTALPPLVSPIIDMILEEHHHSLMLQVLPSLSDQGFGTGLYQVSTQLAGLHQEQLDAQTEAHHIHEASTQAATAATKWASTIHLVVRACEVNSANNLPPIYNLMAHIDKSNTMLYSKKLSASFVTRTMPCILSHLKLCWDSQPPLSHSSTVRPTSMTLIKLSTLSVSLMHWLLR